MSEVENKPKLKKNFSFRKYVDWATEGDNLDRAFDRIEAKTESGEITIDDLLIFGLLTRPKPTGAN